MSCKDDHADANDSGRSRAPTGHRVGCQINRRLAGCDVGRCQETGGGSSTWGDRSASSISITGTLKASAGAKAVTGGTRTTSLLWSPWLQWEAQKVDSLDSSVWWQSGLPTAGAAISANAMTAIEHPG